MPLRIEFPLAKPNLTVRDLKIGQIGIGPTGEIYLSTSSCLVDLQNPQRTYSDSAFFPLTKILAPGESILITVE